MLRLRVARQTLKAFNASNGFALTEARYER